MPKRGFVTAIAATLAVIFGIACPVSAAVILVNPIEDQSANDSNLDGVWDTLRPANQDELLVYNGAQTYNFRVAMEFGIQGVSANAHVKSAILLLKYGGGSGHPGNAMRVSGYAGDGKLTLADFNIAPNPVAPLQDSYSPPGGQWVIDVTPFVQSLVDQHQPYAGFMLENVDVIQTIIFSRESPDPASRPLLSVNFTPVSVPLPAGLVPGAFLGAAAITAKLALGRNRRSRC